MNKAGIELAIEVMGSEEKLVFALCNYDWRIKDYEVRGWRRNIYQRIPIPEKYIESVETVTQIPKQQLRKRLTRKQVLLRVGLCHAQKQREQIKLWRRALASFEWRLERAQLKLEHQLLSKRVLAKREINE